MGRAETSRTIGGWAGPRVVGPVALRWLAARVWLPQKARGAGRRLRAAWRALVGDPASRAYKPPAQLTRGSFAAVESASLLLSLGGGYLTDADAPQTLRVLGLIEHAHRRGVPVAMVGQGLGPLDDPELRSRAADVLPSVAYIGLRERRRGPALLDALGVGSETVQVTGDDAIELAYGQRREKIGSDIGICLRVANYAPVSVEAGELVGRVGARIAAEFDARLAPMVIAEYKSQDRTSTLPLVRGYGKVRQPPGRFARPQEVAARVAGCRVVVTGAYHLAVFALSQGIPVVAVTSSIYYDDKFLGLADMFETGLQLIDLRDAKLANTLSKAIRSAWQQAPECGAHYVPELALRLRPAGRASTGCSSWSTKRRRSSGDDDCS